ncbi:hypothetical protein ACFLYC_03440 [Chloroflexota bacterium]
MSAELGKIEKPSVEEFKTGRKLYFVPLLYGSKELPADYLKIFNKYWKQVDDQISDLELKLGPTNRIYHELIPSAGEDGLKALKNLSEKSFKIVKKRVKSYRGCRVINRIHGLEPLLINRLTESKGIGKGIRILYRSEQE